MKDVKGQRLRRERPYIIRVVLTASVLLALSSSPAVAQEQTMDTATYQGQHTPMPMKKNPACAMQSTGEMGSMNMGSMQGGKAPPNARDTNAYSDGYEYTSMPGMEKTDQMSFGRLLVDQLEYTRSHREGGIAWDVSAWYGPDEGKLYIRSEGDVSRGIADETTSAEALWWHPFTAFWATTLGIRQDFGPGSHTHLALGAEGLASYWFDLQATFYVADNGLLSARLKGSYDLLITNRLILTPEVESNLYSRDDSKRGVGAGIGNIEPQVRLRYEFSRTFAPYVGVDWDRKLGRTADQRRDEDEPVSDTSFVAGIRSLL